MSDPAASGQASKPKRWLAVLLSIVWPGLGFAYLGRGWIGLLVFVATAGCWLIVSVAAIAGRLNFAIFAAAFAASVAIWLSGLVAVFFAARRPHWSPRPFYSRWQSLLALVAIWIACAVFIPRPIEAFSIPASSMIPALQVNDRLISLHWEHVGRSPKRGEIVIFRVPLLNVDYVNRVVGLPGDTVQLVNNVVMVNGQALPQKPLDDLAYGRGSMPIRYRQFEERSPDGIVYRVLVAPSASPFASTKPVVVPPGRLFLLGDNRDNSMDSRFAEIGFVAVENLRARPLFLYYATESSRIGSQVR